MENKIVLVIVCSLTLMVFGFLIGKCTKDAPLEEITKSDTIHITNTIIERDTLFIDKFVPIEKVIVRIDSVFVNDTLFVPIPIEKKIYQTVDYKAEIEGYKANLLSLDIYRENKHTFDTVFINNETTKYKKPKFTLSIGPSLGYDGKKISPYIGVHLGYVIWSR